QQSGGTSAGAVVIGQGHAFGLGVEAVHVVVDGGERSGGLLVRVVLDGRGWTRHAETLDPDDGRLAYAYTQVRQQWFGLVPIDDHVYTAFADRGDLPGVELHHQIPVGVETHGVVQRSRSEEHTSELQSRFDLVCRLL